MTTTSARRRARELVLQGLYQRQLSGNAARRRARRSSPRARGFARADQAYFDELWAGVARRLRRAARARSRRISTASRASSRRSSARSSSSARGSSQHRARDSVPRRDQRSGRAREVLWRHRRPRFVNGVLDKLAADAARGRDRGAARADAARPERDAVGCAVPLALLAATALAIAATPPPRRARPSTAATMPTPASLPRRRSQRETGIATAISAQADRRVLRADPRRARQPEGRRLVRRHDRLRSCRRPPRDCSRRIARRGWPSSQPWARRQTERTPTTRSPRSTGSSSASAPTRRCSRRSGVAAPRCWSDLVEARVPQARSSSPIR